MHSFVMYAESMPPEKSPLGDRIRSARAAKDWKQKHLAAELDVEPITVSRWERGATTPDLDVLGRIAAATGKPVSYFVGGGSDEASRPAPPDIEEAAARIEAAALQIATEVDRLARVVEELRAELTRAR
jgi:transcriptional regulator with XRE-family HTH domain